MIGEYEYLSPETLVEVISVELVMI
jgi:hypothetical protein